MEQLPRPKRTWLECRNLPNTERERSELIDGEVYTMTGPSVLHQIISRQLTLNLAPFLATGPCQLFYAPLDLKLSEYDLVQPDLVVVCHPAQIQATHLEGPPQLVVEILSPSTLRHDRVRKLNLYGRAGVPEYWLVTQHPPMVEVLSNNAGLFTTVGAYTDKDTLLSPSFPTLRLELGSVFANLPAQPPINEVREYTPTYEAEPTKARIPC